MVGDKMGRIHLGRQDLDELQTRKMKGLKRNRDVAAEEEEKEEESDVDVEEDGMDLFSDGDEGSEDGDDGEGVDVKRPRLE